MAAAKKKPARVVVRNDEGPTSNDFAISARVLWWVGGGIGALLVGVVSWFTIWDRIDTHWRLESIQTAKDKEIAATVQAARDKAESDVKQLTRRAEVGRAWLFWSINDSKADNAGRWSEACKVLKWPQQICSRYEADAMRYRQEEIEAKRTATEAGKDK